MQRIAIVERAATGARRPPSAASASTPSAASAAGTNARPYAFSLRQIEHDLEDPSAELHQMAMGQWTRSSPARNCCSAWRFRQRSAIGSPSWRRRDPHLYGRLDLAYNGSGPAKLYRLNYDTPTSLFRVGVLPMAVAGRPAGAGPPGARRRPVQLDP
ncbi:glutathionylspermidine synthase family protein [Curtobacterium flaccumfaciens]|uniref:glutathionylspermidine synthase family protein n=1 Tax=Curtobacterium flaccumfaciens TaxID=2035 RepID=UPI00215B0CFF|nr:glutathionylspermidine synthase family protein [Curtobacterium flaccumfaciens]